jgi:ribonucleoside-diphosphate reductase alpha chain
MNIKISKILKRNGEMVEFDKNRIILAIQKSEESAIGFSSLNFAEEITQEVIDEINEIYTQRSKVFTVEEIQDLVEKKLVESGNFNIAKTYILYRAEHARKRAEERVEELEKIDKHLLKVVKKSGKKQIFSEKKLEKFFHRANKGYEETCTFEEVFEIIKLMIVDGIETSTLINTLRKACIDLISIDNIGWQHIAGRIYTLELYGKAAENRNMKYSEIYTPQSFKTHFDDYIEKKFYYTDFYQYYSEKDILEIATVLQKKRDFEYGYSTMLAFNKRYLLNPNKIIHELPQEMYLAAALFLAIPEKNENRLEVAKKMYEMCSSQKISLPTPTLINARTNYHQLSSCFKLNIDDDLRGIYHQIENMAQISKFGGGIGTYLGNIRAKGSAIRYVKNASGGTIPWVKVMNDTATAVNQLGARNGAISPTLDIWHLDIVDFLNLQTETGDIRAKAFDVFPAISVPDIFMKRVEANEQWTLFDPYEVEKITGKKLQDHFDNDTTKAFEDFYVECENNPEIKMKETMPAKDLMKTALKTTVETGMPYFFFRDTVNKVNPNKHAGNIYSTQLCTEICQNTSPSQFVEEIVETKDGKNFVNIQHQMGDTVVCNLASINMAKVNTQKDIDAAFPVAMRILDNVITLNFYPIKEAEYTAKKYRSVGLGFMGLAEYLACKKLAYDKQEAREETDKLFEKYAFATLQESQKLAKERGQYELFEGSQWSKGILFGRDEKWYKNNAKTDLNWSGLISDIKQTGLRFAYHLSPAPNTSTAGVVGTTAGLLPIYKRLFVETNSIAPVVNVAPHLSQENFWFYKEYQHLNMEDVIDMFEVIYKWIDQSASFEWMINPAEVSPAMLYSYYMKSWKSGIKTVYYVRSMSGEVKEDCASCSG